MKWICYLPGRLLLTLGALLIIGGICSPLFGDSPTVKPARVVRPVATGGFLIFCALLLLKPPSLTRRPPFWFPAISGILCSALFLVFGVWVVIKRAHPEVAQSDWLHYLALFCALGCVSSALVSVLTGARALVELRRESSDEKKPPID